MNKDLKNEYVNMILSDTPDLWDQISAALSEKQSVNEKKKKTKIYRLGLLAAACVCVAILIPVALHMGKSAQTFETAAAMDVETTAEEPRVEMARGEDAKEHATPLMPSSDTGFVPETALRMTETQAVEESAAAPKMPEELIYEMEQSSPDEVFLEAIQIRITESMEDGLYLADVLDSTGYLTQGDIILVQADENSPEEFMDGIQEGSYTCNLQEIETPDGDIVYLLR